MPRSLAHSTSNGVADFDRVSFIDVSKYFGRRRALAHVSFECEAGEIVGLLGGNGAGKSTVRGLAATILQPSSGQVRYGGRSREDLGLALNARIGVLAHELQLYPELTARENLEFFASLYGLDQGVDRAAEALARAGLMDRGDDFLDGFSRGMRQRVALERALLHEPQLLLLDEPFTGLDEGASMALIERLQALKTAGRIVILSTHDFEIAEMVVDRAILLRAGRLTTMAPEGGSLRDRYRDVTPRVGDAGGSG